MTTLFTILLLGCIASTALAHPTLVSLPLPTPVVGQETVGELVVEGEWG